MTEAWFVGVDWGSKEHHVCLLDASGKVVGQRAFNHNGEGLSAMADWLLGCTGKPPSEVGVAIEVPHGPVVESLMERGFNVHSINPKQLDRFRDRFSVAGAKDDRRDARVLAAALRTDPECLRRLQAPGRSHSPAARLDSSQKTVGRGTQAALESGPRPALALLPAVARSRQERRLG